MKEMLNEISDKIGGKKDFSETIIAFALMNMV
jgi:hypothetical protein